MVTSRPVALSSRPLALLSPLSPPSVYGGVFSHPITEQNIKISTNIVFSLLLSPPLFLAELRGTGKAKRSPIKGVIR